jgi:hypothetical protein
MQLPSNFILFFQILINRVSSNLEELSHPFARTYSNEEAESAALRFDEIGWSFHD